MSPIAYRDCCAPNGHTSQMIKPRLLCTKWADISVDRIMCNQLIVSCAKQTWPKSQTYSTSLA